MPDLSKVTGILPDLADYLVYGAIAVVTLIGLFKCLLPLWKTTSCLRRAISRLQAEAGQTTEKPVWQTCVRIYPHIRTRGHLSDRRSGISKGDPAEGKKHGRRGKEGQPGGAYLL